MLKAFATMAYDWNNYKPQGVASLYKGFGIITVTITGVRWHLDDVPQGRLELPYNKTIQALTVKAEAK